MLNLPPGPLKEIYFDEDDEFIKEAKRRRSYSEPCWCGSKLPYKKCHRSRSSQKPVSFGKVKNDQRKIFWKPRGCMHPNTSPDVCRGKIIDSHTIQRKGPLARIIDSSKHVFHLNTNYKTNNLEIQSLGWRKASIFPGFCSLHDTDLFKDLETEKFTGTKNSVYYSLLERHVMSYTKRERLLNL